MSASIVLSDFDTVFSIADSKPSTRLHMIIPRREYGLL